MCEWSVSIRARDLAESQQRLCATEQATMDAQCIRHACSARLRINHPSWRDFALASRLTNCLASPDHRPDASIPKTTNRALARGPTSSRYLLSFRRLAAVKATPSTSAEPLLLFHHRAECSRLSRRLQPVLRRTVATRQLRLRVFVRPPVSDLQNPDLSPGRSW